MGQSLKASEEYKDFLEKEVSSLRKKEKQLNSAQQRIEDLEKQLMQNKKILLEKEKQEKDDGAKRFQSTEGLRRELKGKEEEIERLVHQVNVDCVRSLEAEKIKTKHAEQALVRAESRCQDLQHEMVRIKAVRLGDDFAQKEEEYARIHLKVGR